MKKSFSFINKPYIKGLLCKIIYKILYRLAFYTLYTTLGWTPFDFLPLE